MCGLAGLTNVGPIDVAKKIDERRGGQQAIIELADNPGILQSGLCGKEFVVRILVESHSPLLDGTLLFTEVGNGSAKLRLDLAILDVRNVNPLVGCHVDLLCACHDNLSTASR